MPAARFDGRDCGSGVAGLICGDGAGLIGEMVVAGLHSVAPLVGLAGHLVRTVAPGLLDSVVSVVTDGNIALNGPCLLPLCKMG